MATRNPAGASDEPEVGGTSSASGSAEPKRRPTGLDTSRPTPARMYDYFLGGKDNFPVDRAAAERVKEATPDTYEIVWENRYFLQRAVRFLAEAGIDQFLDLGTGLPTQGNVHEIVQGVNPDARVVYVDNDPIVLAHGRALLAENARTTVVTADMRDPEGVLAHPDIRELLDFSRPVAVLFVAVMHFIQDAEDPAGIVRTFREVMAPGSYLALSHLTTDGPDPAMVKATEAVYENATSPIIFRPKARIEEMFDGFELVEPGLVRPWEWRPDTDGQVSTNALFGGIARLAG
ncbi:SAM-dependent methyltransferase [Yinghuangia sp. ASG 101]|uniref:SAM-dependent methyltransferase n=1 Tax=Yinghuangia sp. ASG 101 TaxID=2896848 RepID=UPI001E647474|nr:SAM-dependent methyltransferase [Yinghuangia sp. ASG 101]UGQ12643.1 SAM-dependent methyltransferase [Yinghuangia sp. ASG 101]